MNRITAALLATGMAWGALGTDTAPGQSAFPFRAPQAGPNPSLGTGYAKFGGDLNGDGRDEVFAMLGHWVAWAIAGPGGVYGPPQTLTLPAGLGSGNSKLHAVADFTGDGNNDALISWDHQPMGIYAVDVFPGNGSGQLGTPISLPNAPSTLWDEIGVGEYDLTNGTPEVVVVSRLSLSTPNYDIRILSRDPATGSWNVMSSLITSVSNTFVRFDELADLNGDGLLDLVGSSVSVANANLGAYTDVFVAPGINVPPYFGTPATLSRPGPPVPTGSPAPLVGDLDRDGLDDVVMLEWSSSTPQIYVAFGTPNGFLTGWSLSATLPATLAGVPTVTLIDVDQDGILDVMSQSNPNPWPQYAPLDVEFLRGDGAGGFLPYVSMTGMPAGFANASYVDADGDGDLDIVNIFTPTTTVCLNDSLIGRGTVSSLGVRPTITRGTASPGNGAFHFTVENAPVGAACLLGVSSAGLTSLPANGIALDLSSLLWPLGTYGATMTDGSGRATFQLPLPATGLAGAEAFGQWAVGDPGLAAGHVVSPGTKIVFW